jgi:ABC-type oligopeptide transport system substrate-binding subunit
MMPMKKRLAAVLAAVLCIGCCGCNSRGGSGQLQDPYDQYEDYDAQCKAIYDDALGEFFRIYLQAKSANSVSMRHAMMAVAEAKLLSAAVFLPLNASGGNYAISRLAPYTVPSVLWGNDNQRLHRGLVTTQPITATHRDEMKAKWYELSGSGDYLQWAVGYLQGKGYQLKDSYTVHYSSDPQTWDVLATSKSADTDAIVHTYDGLYEYDCEGVLQPALATGYEKTLHDDGTVSYTFRLRKGVQWVDSQGRPVAKVKADDFVAGMQHLLDARGGLEYLVAGHSAQDSLIVNAYAYSTGSLTDFSQVGVAAPDEHTVVYTLTRDEPYFMTMLGYSVFAPMSREYFLTQGGGFGADFDPAAASYLYGKGPDHIAACGPYVVAFHTAENAIGFRENPTYWNKDKVTVKSLTWNYHDGKDALRGYQDVMTGVVDGSPLNASSLEKAKADGVFSELAYVGLREAVSTVMFYNLNRQAFRNFNDQSGAASQKKELEQQRTALAMSNVHFRRAISFAANRSAYNAQSRGEDLKKTTLRNSFTPGDFVHLTEPVTLTMGDKTVTYEAGTAYGQILQDQLLADGVGIVVWDEKAEEGNGSGDGFDGWYNPEEAARELAVAMEELSGQGVNISPEEPIVLELPYFAGSDPYTNRANAYKQAVEQSLGSAVRIQPVACPDMNSVYYAGYYIGYGYEANFDLYDLTGWGPDYGDPQTYLDTFLPDYAGYLTKMLGLF